MDPGMGMGTSIFNLLIMSSAKTGPPRTKSTKNLDKHTPGNVNNYRPSALHYMQLALISSNDASQNMGIVHKQDVLEHEDHLLHKDIALLMTETLLRLSKD